MLRQCTDADVTAVCAIINDAAQAYRGVIPSECWRDPYMSRAALCGGDCCGRLVFSLGIGW